MSRGFSQLLKASEYDQRFSYYLYIPDRHAPGAGETYPLLVLVHSTGREAHAYVDAFKSFADDTGAAILAPLFPTGIIDKDDIHNYKFIKFHDIRFDRVLLAMIDEAAERYPVAGERFLLHGFSGGGQFAHRFYYLHPERLLGVSIGAPGRVTYLDDSALWYNGIRDFAEQFGATLEREKLRRVPVHMVVGSEDKETGWIDSRSDQSWLEGSDARGRTRVERLRALREDFEREGIATRYDEVPGVAHEGFKVLHTVKRFFADILQRKGDGECR
ncbi:hypothetical protein [Paenibacillus hamazuiensis]|uniref:hypothetical protein n=1 Tax=Paenibacillus hamazuiensis TaxID=2936508 RepID=UPI00201029E4|nr:hypothetical protein [Paenibacillus hamazuiensis]